jgi:hypothetical protein
MEMFMSLFYYIGNGKHSTPITGNIGNVINNVT